MEESNDKIEVDTCFDLYTHMKVNIKCSSTNCEIHDSDFTHYCFTCRRPVCEICKESFHSSHSIQTKSLINFEANNINYIFKDLENNLSNTRILIDPEGYRKELKNKINSEFEEIENLIIGLKKRKMHEIDNVFNEAKGSKQLQKLVKDSKKSIFDYFNKYKDSYYNFDIKDEDNAIFLQSYDLFNIGIQAADQYNNIIKNIKDFYDSYEKGTGFKYQGIKNEIEKSLEEERKNEILFNNLHMFDINSNTIEANKNSLVSNNINILKRDSKNTYGNINNNCSSNNSNSSVSTIKPNINHDMFRKQVSTNFERLNEDFFKDLRERITKTAEFMEVFKKTTFESFKKHGSLIDIEKTVKMFDEKTNKRTNFIKGKAKLNFSPSQAKAYSTSGMIPQSGMTRSKNTLGLVSPKKDNSHSISITDNTNKIDSKEQSNQSKEQQISKSNNNINNEKTNKAEIKHFHHTTSGSKDYKKYSKDMNLECLKEEQEEEYTCSDQSERENCNSPDENINNNEDEEYEDDGEEQSKGISFDKDDNDSVKLENGYGIEKKYSKAELKLVKMFKPKKKKVKLPNNNKSEKKSEITSSSSANNNNLNLNKKEKPEQESKYKVNNKLQELIKENQKLCQLIKKKEDITLNIVLIRRYYSYMVLEFIRKNFFKLTHIGGQSQNILEDTAQQEEEIVKDSIKLFEGTNELLLYCRDKRKLVRKTISIEKKIHGISHFLAGSRTFYTKDRVYITGGKDCNQEYKVFLFYSIKENKLYRLNDMNNFRSYHTMVYHENLKSILVFGGENNKTCEMFDFFLGSWTDIPELNLPRANISIFIDKIGTFAYAFCGTTGTIANGMNSDSIELLDLVDMNQGWARVEYCNKANVDFKFSHTGVYPLTDDKILIYGASESRKMQKCFVIFNLRTFDVTKIDRELLETLRMNAMKNPELSRIFL